MRLLLALVGCLLAAGLALLLLPGAARTGPISTSQRGMQAVPQEAALLDDMPKGARMNGVTEVAPAPPVLETQRLPWRLVGNISNAATGRPIGVPASVDLDGPGEFGVGMTDDDGREYGLDLAQPGRYLLRAEAEGFMPLERSVVLAGEPGTQRLDLELQPSRLVLIRAATPSGEDLERALAVAGVEARSGLAVAVTAAAPGERLHGRPPRRGTFQSARFDTSLAAIKFVRGEAPIPADTLGVLEPFELGPLTVALVFDRTVIASLHLAADAGELKFVVPVERIEQRLASVEVVVSDLAGLAVPARASVSEFRFLFLESELPGGRANFTRLSPGRYILVVEAAGLERRVLSLDLAPGERRRVEVKLAPARALTGRVVDPQGRGVLADVQVMKLDGAPVIVAQRWTEEDGRFTIEGLGPGAHVLFLAADSSSATNRSVLEWTAPAVQLDLDRARPGPLTIKASRGGLLELAREDPDPRPLDFLAKDEAGVLLRSGSVRRFSQVDLRLAAGTYTVEVARDGRALDRFAVQVGGQAARLVLR